MDKHRLEALCRFAGVDYAELEAPFPKRSRKEILLMEQSDVENRLWREKKYHENLERIFDKVYCVGCEGLHRKPSREADSADITSPSSEDINNLTEKLNELYLRLYRLTQRDPENYEEAQALLAQITTMLLQIRMLKNSPTTEVSQTLNKLIFNTSELKRTEMLKSFAK